MIALPVIPTGGIMKDTIHVLIVCGYGLGTSAMTEGLVSKALTKRNIRFEIEHTAAGEAAGLADWVDIIAVSKKLLDIVSAESFPGKPIIEIENITDGEKIAGQIEDIVKTKFSGLIGGN